MKIPARLKQRLSGKNVASPHLLSFIPSESNKLLVVHQDNVCLVKIDSQQLESTILHVFENNEDENQIHTITRICVSSQWLAISDIKNNGIRIFNLKSLEVKLSSI